MFGVDDGPPLSFLTGIRFVTSCSKQMVPLLEDVVQADGAHKSYGKYTLFTAYGTSANGNMVLVAGAILFGNEDKVNWFKFWTFLKTHHPSLSCPKKTILTDQDKGSIAAVADIMDAAQFHCCYHRRNNIIKERGGDIKRDGNCHRCTVKSTLKASSKKFTVVIPMEEDQFGSRFGTCTCGKPAKEGIPCQHMVVVAKSSAIDDLPRIGIIPGCMTKAFWKEQYAQIVQCHAASMSDIKVNYNYTPDDSLRCMPEVLAPNKTGYPKKNAHCKGVTDHIESAGKRKRKKKMFCTICQKFNHKTADCWMNKSKRQEKTGSNSNNDEQEDEELRLRIIAEQAGL
jgi:hypothetical protein